MAERLGNRATDLKVAGSIPLVMITLMLDQNQAGAEGSSNSNTLDIQSAANPEFQRSVLGAGEQAVQKLCMFTRAVVDVRLLCAVTPALSSMPGIRRPLVPLASVVAVVVHWVRRG